MLPQKYRNQLGKKIQDPGAHMPHAVVGILLKKQRKKDRLYHQKGGSKVKPVVEYNPYPEVDGQENGYKPQGVNLSTQLGGDGE